MKRLLCLAVLLNLSLASCQKEEVRADLRNDLGFIHGTPYIDGAEVLVIDEVFFGGVFEASGLKSGDVIKGGFSVIEFYSMLEENRGKSVQLEIERGSKASKPIKKTYLIFVPKK